MSKIIDIKHYANTTQADCGKMRNLSEAMHTVRAQLKDVESTQDRIASSLACGWNFYHRLKKEMDDTAKTLTSNPRGVPFNTFGGLRFILDEQVPPNECEIRNRDGIVIGRFKF